MGEPANGPSAAHDPGLRSELLGPVLSAVRAIGVSGDVDDILQRICDQVVGVLAFRAAALSVRNDDGRLYVRAVAGPDGAKELLHTSATVAEWEALLRMCTPSADVLFLDHRLSDDDAVEAVQGWAEAAVPDLPEDVWHAEDTLLAPMRTPDGDLVAVLSADLPIGSVHDHDQRTALGLFTAQAHQALADHRERARLDRLRREAEQRLRLVWHSGLVASAVIGPDGRMVDANEAAAQSLGWSVEEIIGRSYLDFVPEGTRSGSAELFETLKLRSDPTVVDRVLRHRDGHSIWAAMFAAPVLASDDEQPSVVVQWTDITDRKREQERLERQARNDPLTNLPNRRALEEYLADLFRRAVDFGVLYCDVDGFKGIAAGLGHEIGDELLAAIAARFREHVPVGSYVARLIGDEFLVCLPGVPRLETGLQVAEDLLAALSEPVVLGGQRYHVAFSIGVSGTRGWHHHPADVLREADQALARAKRRGGARVEVFDPVQDHPATRADRDLETALRSAVDDHQELEAHFQTVISLDTSETVGYEALLRWRHPGYGVLLPQRFLPLAERSGFSAALGWRVLDLVSRSVPTSLLSRRPRPWIAVNVAAAQLGRGQLVPALRRLQDDGIFAADPSLLHLEITETSLLEATPATVDELFAAVELGARISLDDFGTGYSSLTLLRDLPVAAIKIDRSFITPIAVDVRVRTIVQHTIELCRGLGIATIAEGIETHEQLAWLRTLGCEYGQGYLIDRPSAYPFPA